MVRCQIYKARFLNIYGDLQMKKSLIALAALASVATVAQAQSSVTVYGIMDVGIAKSTNINSAGQSVTGMANGGLSTSRIGFRGVEDLGGGLKANFNLEAEILGDVGSQASTPEALFARQSTVGLEGGFGRVDLGRINSGSYALQAKFDPMGANNIGGIIATGQVGQVRVENSVTFTSPSFNGLQVALQTGTRTSTTTATYGEMAGETTGNRNNTASLSYTAGNLELATYIADSKDAAGTKLHDNTGAFARYNFGVARVTAGYINVDLKNKAAAASTTAANNTSGAFANGNTIETTKTFVGVNVPVGTNTTITGMVEQIQYKRQASTDQEPMIYTLAATYNLSKRTSLYAIYSQVNQDNGSAQTNVSTSKFAEFSAAVADKDKSSYAVGIRHSF
jgi:predicted porin